MLNGMKEKYTGMLRLIQPRYQTGIAASGHTSLVGSVIPGPVPVYIPGFHPA